MNYADALGSIRTILLKDNAVSSIAGNRIWTGYTDIAISSPCIVITLRSPGKSDLSHAHRRLQVNIRCYSPNSIAEAMSLQAAVEDALRSAQQQLELSPLVYIEADCPFQIAAGNHYGISQNIFAIAKEV